MLCSRGMVVMIRRFMRCYRRYWVFREEMLCCQDRICVWCGEYDLENILTMFRIEYKRHPPEQLVLRKRIMDDEYS